jgi:hypothetical protein
MTTLPSTFPINNSFKGKCFKLMSENGQKKDEYIGKFVQYKFNDDAAAYGRKNEVHASLLFEKKNSNDEVSQYYVQLPMLYGQVNWEVADNRYQFQETECIGNNAPRPPPPPPRKWSNFWQTIKNKFKGQRETLNMTPAQPFYNHAAKPRRSRRNRRNRRNRRSKN